MTELRPEIQKCLQLAETLLEQALRCDGAQRIALCEAATGAFVTAAALVPVLQDSPHHLHVAHCLRIAEMAINRTYGLSGDRTAALTAAATEALQAAAMIATNTEEQGVSDRVKELTHRLRKLIPEA